MEWYHEALDYGPSFVPNGYLVVVPYTRKLADEYQGIDDDQWPLGPEDYARLRDLLGVPPQLMGVQVATRWDRTVAYWRDCRAAGLEPRLLLVSTRYREPEIVAAEAEWVPVGYDVAEPLGQHSAVRHELIAGPLPQLAGWRRRLNRAGLFDTVEAAEEYMADRLRVAAAGERAGMELGSGFRFVPVLIHRCTPGL
jgi:hypothetical protein